LISPIDTASRATVVCVRDREWPTLAGYALFVSLMTAGYDYNGTFVQFGLIGVGTRLVGLPRDTVSAWMESVRSSAASSARSRSATRSPPSTPRASTGNASNPRKSPGEAARGGERPETPARRALDPFAKHGLKRASVRSTG
jgi:hypothetical protein